jgi:predicted Zn-ribbon and HTH transcriptional regulator
LTTRLLASAGPGVIVLDPNSSQAVGTLARKSETEPRVFPIPQVNDDNRAFWTGGRDGELRIVRCNDCGYYIHPPSPRCPRCLGKNVESTPVSGRVHVYT